MYIESPGLRHMLDHIRFHEEGFDVSPAERDDLERLIRVRDLRDAALVSENWEEAYVIARELYTLAWQYAMTWLLDPRKDGQFIEDDSLA